MAFPAPATIFPIFAVRNFRPSTVAHSPRPTSVKDMSPPRFPKRIKTRRSKQTWFFTSQRNLELKRRCHEQKLRSHNSVNLAAQGKLDAQSDCWPDPSFVLVAPPSFRTRPEKRHRRQRS